MHKLGGLVVNTGHNTWPVLFKYTMFTSKCSLDEPSFQTHNKVMKSQSLNSATQNVNNIQEVLKLELKTP